MASYTDKEREELIDIICSRIAQGESLRSILKPDNTPTFQTFLNWINKDDRRIEQYARAMELRADYLFDELLEISDNTIEGKVIETDEYGRTKEKVGDMLGHRRLQIDTRKWALSKMNPKKYSDKLQVDNSKFSEQPLFPDVPANNSNK